MKKTNFLLIAGISTALSIVTITACGPDRGDLKEADKTGETPTEQPAATEEKPAADDGKGIGEIKNVELTTPLNADMVTRGEAIYDMKCAACHKLDATKVVGPGWKGVTERRKPEWIMNFVTNVDIMLDQDPEAQKLLEECLTRMPNQNISVGDARDLLEFMRKNDGVN